MACMNLFQKANVDIFIAPGFVSAQKFRYLLLDNIVGNKRITLRVPLCLLRVLCVIGFTLYYGRIKSRCTKNTKRTELHKVSING